jgi:hypothetical protein
MAATATSQAAPAAIVAIAMAWLLAAALARVRRSRYRKVRELADLASICDLTAIGLTGGLGVQPALEMAVRHVDGEVSLELGALLQRCRVDGIAAAMTTAHGAGRRLYRVVGAAVATGSSLLDSVARLAHDLHSELAASELEAVRKLPVTMLFPLTLLILPGFLLVAIAPAILDAFSRLELSP